MKKESQTQKSINVPCAYTGSIINSVEFQFTSYNVIMLYTIIVLILFRRFSENALKLNITIIMTHSERALFNLNARVEARGTIVPKAVGTMVPRDDTRAFKLNRTRSLCVIIILTNITRILYVNGMQYLKKSDSIKNKQLSLSLRYIFVKMLPSGREIIMQ